MNHETRMGVRRNELLLDLVEVVERALQECDVPAQAARLAANAVADRLADHWGGQNLSFPKDYLWKLSKQELEIYDDWCRGASFDALAQRHHMTERGLRKLIARTRTRVRAQLAAEQTGLFEPADAG